MAAKPRARVVEKTEAGKTDTPAARPGTAGDGRDERSTTEMT